MSVPLILHANVFVDEGGSQDGFPLDDSTRLFDFDWEAESVRCHLNESLIRVENRGLVSETLHFNPVDVEGGEEEERKKRRRRKGVQNRSGEGKGEI